MCVHLQHMMFQIIPTMFPGVSQQNPPFCRLNPHDEEFQITMRCNHYNCTDMTPCIAILSFKTYPN